MHPFPMISGRPCVPRPLLDIDARQASPDARLVVSRASTAGYMDSDGVYKTVAIDAPRLVSGKGLLIEAASSNLIVWARDLTRSNWVKTSITAAKDQAGIDGAASAASSLTATADGGSAVYGVGSYYGSNWCFSVYIRRVSGSGAVSVTLNGGTTWAAVAVTDAWTRLAFVGTTGNVGIRLAKACDVVAVDGAQLEYYGGNRVILPTSAIMTSGSALTRAADVVTLNVAGLDLSAFSLRVDHIVPVDPAGRGYAQALSVSNGTDGNSLDAGIFAAATNNFFSQLQVGGSAATWTASANYPASWGGVVRNAVTLASGRFAHAANGLIAAATGTPPTTPPAFDRLQFNTRGAGGYNGAMILQRFMFWQVPLHDEHLRRISE
ncbi:MAG TPA: hypothetical protein DCW68_02625 [Rhodospirillaceae bacterium]|nr:MAG: hypothetical protein A2018_05600 [Alphaproteobacteria bacterium GWF2_58_20]HAU28989.1 hypothetical protein [Rhodospirillaceae bacterium]